MKRPSGNYNLDSNGGEGPTVNKRSDEATFIEPDVIPGPNGSVIYRGIYALRGIYVCCDNILSGDRWYKVPYQAPSTKPSKSAISSQNTYDGTAFYDSAGSVTLLTNRTGFKELGSFATIWPTAHCSNMAYRYNRGAPEVSNRNLESSYLECKTAWQLSIFRGIHVNNPDFDDKERYIFTGSNAKNGDLFQKLFMRLGDLENCIQKGNDAIALEDKKAVLGQQPRIPYPLWDYNGKPIDESQYLGIFQNIGMGCSIGKGENNDEEWIRNSFMWHCRLARQAQVNPCLSYSVLSRFWDRNWEPSQSFILVVPQSAFQSNDLMARIDSIREERNFKPRFKIVLDSNFNGRDDYILWAHHPNKLYSIYAHRSVVEEVKGNTELGLWLQDRPFPSQEQVREVDAEMRAAMRRCLKDATYVTGRDAKTTHTSITINSMTAAGKWERDPDEVTVMGGQAPNALATEWWGTGRYERAAEWLNRSAWSYGGLNAGPVHMGPLSSQSMSNLVFSTCEVDIAMLRYETFAKRLAQYAKDGDEDTTVSVTTSIKTDSQLNPLWVNGPDPMYAWFVPELQYEIKSHSQCNIDADITVNFATFSRRIPTRFEIQLDELFESICYGWSSSNE